MKKLVSLLLSVSITFTMLTAFGVNVSATQTWNGSTSKSWTKGTGTSESPFLIENEENLMHLAELSNTDSTQISGKYFKLTADMDLSACTNWKPIGYCEKYSFGNAYFDGNNHTIKNLTSFGAVDDDGYVAAGLFGWVVGATVKNLRVENANITATGNNQYSFAGGLIGVAYDGTVQNCYVMNSSVTGSRISNQSCATGGFSGYSTGSSFSNSGVFSTTVNSSCYGGGFVGEVDDSYDVGDTSFNKCYVVSSTIASASNRGQISSQHGGFIGTITDCPNLVANNCFVSSTTIIEGEGAVASTAGGAFAGNCHSGILKATNCYVDAAVSADYLTGAFGKENSSTRTVALTNCYYNSEKVSSDEIQGLTEKNSVQIKSSELAGLLGDAFIYKNGLVVLSETMFPAMPEVKTTPVLANASIPTPTYTVTIPSTIDFGEQNQALAKFKDKATDQDGNPVVVSQTIRLSATGVADLFDDLEDGKADYLTIEVAHTGKIVGTTHMENEVPFILKQGNNELATGAKIASFYNDMDLGKEDRPTENKATAEITINRADITKADSYSGRLTFTIAVADK